MKRKWTKVLTGTVIIAILLGCFPGVPGCEIKAGQTSEPATSYRDLFNNMYQDVITNGMKNGFFSSDNNSYPYHAVETLYIDDEVEYGHLSTAEDAANYMNVAMLCEAVNKQEAEVSKAWNTLKEFIPETQTGYMRSIPSKTYQDALDTVEEYPKNAYVGNEAHSPIQQVFNTKYTEDTGLRLFARLVDVDNWYGYSNGTTPIFINSFKRGTAESVWETIPHPAIENLEFGTARGMLGLFSTETSIPKQYVYESNGRAEKIAVSSLCQAVENEELAFDYSELGSQVAVTADELRTLFYDQYYKELGCQNKWSLSAGDKSKHYLFSSSTEWGGHWTEVGQLRHQDVSYAQRIRIHMLLTKYTIQNLF